MTQAELPVVLNLYARIAPGELFRVLQRNLNVRTHFGIYTPRVVIWMMLLQHLDRRGTMEAAVERLAQGAMDPLLSRCKRVREQRISVATGGYCKARQNLSKLLVERSMREIVERLRHHLSEPSSVAPAPVYVLDGSSLQLSHSAGVAREYPPAPNQYGHSHWPVVRLVVLHELETGLAQTPCWGPMYGQAAVSEQTLAQQAMEALPPESVIVADRNFGVFSIACAAWQRGHQVIVRMTEVRAKRLAGGQAICEPGEYAVTWRRSRWDQTTPELAADTAIAGRLIAWRVGRGKKKSWLYLFTTLPVSAEQVVELYGKRWTVETDLRSLKQCVRLHRLQVKSVDIMQKELMAAVLAYNLVRAIMCMAARAAGLHPRQLSFTYAHNIVQDGIANVLDALSEPEQVQRLERIVALVARCKLPHRKKRRAYPRAVWQRGRKYPERRTEK
jgi:hypothetical protein